MKPAYWLVLYTTLWRCYVWPGLWNQIKRTEHLMVRRFLVVGWASNCQAYRQALHLNI